jgi:hypothetical protein
MLVHLWLRRKWTQPYARYLMPEYWDEARKVLLNMGADPDTAEFTEGGAHRMPQRRKPE